MFVNTYGCLRNRKKYVKYILISCGCVLLYTNKFSCKHASDGVSTSGKSDSHAA